MDEFYKQVLQYKKDAQRERIQIDVDDDDHTWLLWLIGAAALAIIVVAIGFYAYFLHGPVSRSGQEWANFGSYLGGAVGPALSLLSILALLITIRQQARTFLKAEDRARADQHIRALDGYLADLRRIEESQIRVGVTFADVLAGYEPPEWEKPGGEAMSEKYFSARQSILESYFGTLFRYSGMVAMHRDNNRNSWDLDLYVSRGLFVRSSLEPFIKSLNPMHLAIIEMNLLDQWDKNK